MLIQDKEKLIDMVDMRKNGASYREIGKKYHISKQRVHQLIGVVIKNPKNK